MGKAIIFDGNSILNRAFYGVRPLNAPDGLPTNALYGFVGIIRKSFAQIGNDPDFAAIAFDLPEKTFRHKANADYKANRKGMPEELALQMPYAHTVSEALGLCVFECPGYEADDILGTLSKRFSDSGDKCYIVTGDRDSYQLVNENVTVLLASNNETKVITPEFIQENFKLPPKSMIDVKALMGDASDNISGVPGIGEKGALSLIQKYGSLDSVYEHLDEQKGAMLKKLEDGRKCAYDSRFLAEICLDAPLCKGVDDCKYEGHDSEKLTEIFTRLGFRRFLEQMDEEKKENAEEIKEPEFSTMGEKVPGKDGDRVFLDLKDGKIFAYCEGNCFNAESDEEISRLFLSDRKFICWSAKEIITLCADRNIKCPKFDDVSLTAYVLSAADGDSFGKLALDKTGVVSKDVNVTLLPKLYDILVSEMNEEQKELYENIEMPLCYVLSNMERRGFRVDKEELEKFSDSLSEEISEAEQAIYFIAGEDFNINSPKQLGTILFEKLKMPHYRKTKNGYSTDAETLQKLVPYSPIIPLILDYRRDTKLKSTYCEGLSKQISDDGRIHTTFKQAQTLTGRLSSAEPNLQNIPVRSEKGREIRKFFVADDNHVLIDADYSQIELRVLAHVSGDEALRNAFLSGEDIHTVTASQVFNVSREEVTPEMRKRAKAVNFGIIYGIGEYSLSQDIHVSRREAAEYIENYFRKYPRVREYLDKIKEDAYENGYVSTMFGRRRYIPELSARNKNVKAFGERVAMNTPIQGSAADLIKLAMIKAEKMLREADIDAKLILQIHDELIVESSEKDCEKARDILKKAMLTACDMTVPLVVDIGVGRSWFDAKKD